MTFTIDGIKAWLFREWHALKGERKTIFTINDIKIELTKENRAIRLTTDNDDDVILQNQTMAFVESVVKENSQIVKSYYQAKSGVSIENRCAPVIQKIKKASRISPRGLSHIVNPKL